MHSHTHTHTKQIKKTNELLRRILGNHLFERVNKDIESRIHFYFLYRV